MAVITLQIHDFEIEADEIAIGSAWEAVAMLEGNSIEPGELHDEWSMLDRYIREDCEVSLDFERVARWIHEGDLSHGELRDLSYRAHRELVDRLESIRESADELQDTIRQQADRIRELEGSTAE